MKWFKHDTDAREDLRIKLLKEKYGCEGYGVYFQLLEIVGNFIKDDNFSLWSAIDPLYSHENLAKECGISKNKFEKILAYCVELELLEENNGLLKCPKILKRLDEYALRIMKKSGQTPDNVPTKSGANRELDKDKDKDKDKNIDTSGEEPRTPKETKVWERPELSKRTKLQRIIYHLEDTLNTRITTWGKQGEALKNMEKAGYTEEQITKVITYMHVEDPFFRDKGFDLMTVCNQIPLIKAKLTGNQKGAYVQN